MADPIKSVGIGEFIGGACAKQVLRPVGDKITTGTPILDGAILAIGGTIAGVVSPNTGIGGFVGKSVAIAGLTQGADILYDTAATWVKGKVKKE